MSELKSMTQGSFMSFAIVVLILASERFPTVMNLDTYVEAEIGPGGQLGKKTRLRNGSLTATLLLLRNLRISCVTISLDDLEPQKKRFLVGAERKYHLFFYPWMALTPRSDLRRRPILLLETYFIIEKLDDCESQDQG